jgi:signal transduction protein with GAF and PtsI domain
MTLGNNIQFFYLGKDVCSILLYTTFASSRMIATELLCHGDKKVQVGVLRRNHGGGVVGRVSSHVALLNCQKHPKWQVH